MKFSIMPWLGIAVLFLSVVSGKKESFKPLFNREREPKPVIGPYPAGKPESAIAPLPVAEPAPKPVVAPLPVAEPAPKPKSGSVDATRTKTGSGDRVRTGSRSSDSDITRSGSGDRVRTGSRSGDSDRTRSGSGDRVRTGSRSGDSDITRSGSGDRVRTGSRSGDSDRTRSGSGDRVRTGSRSGDSDRTKTGSNDKNIIGSGSGDIERPRSGSGDPRSPRTRSGDTDEPRRRSPEIDIPDDRDVPDDRDIPDNKDRPIPDDRDVPDDRDIPDNRDRPIPDDRDVPDDRDIPDNRVRPIPDDRDVPDDRDIPDNKDRPIPDDRDVPDDRDIPDDSGAPDGSNAPRRSPKGRYPDGGDRPARRFPRRRRPAHDKTGDLKRVAGRTCADSFSRVGCSYYKAKGMCASKAGSHVRMAWTKCRRTCGLCKEVVPNCLPGFRFNEALQICTDIDECAEGTSVCAANAKCVNKEGSYSCRCNTGFVGNGKVLCQAQCADSSVICAKHASDCFLSSRQVFMAKACPVTCGRCSVTCAKGYKLGSDGKTCVNVNECAESTAVCPVHSTCVDTKGSYQCTCNAGYIYNVITQSCIQYCADLSTECASLQSECFVGTSMQQAWMATYCAATCQFCDMPRCARGYKLSVEGKCIDLDECSSTELNECATNANCINTEGSYTCECMAGYRGNGFVECTTLQCYDLLSPSVCETMARTGGCQSGADRAFRFCARTCKVCTNDEVQTCSKGYVAKNGVCLDLNECNALAHRCPANSMCVNTFGGYRCSCNQGYSASKFTGEWACVLENTCYVAGDPHFKTFDGAVIQFQGVCTYTLAKPNPKKRGILSDFSVEIKNEHRDGEMKLSWAKSIRISLFGTVIVLDRDGVVIVNGEQKSVPYSPVHGVDITPSGRDIQVTTMFGLKVSFDGFHYVKVSIPDSYRRKMTGICGNLDGKTPNDYVTKEGVPTQSHATIGNSWAVPDPAEVCQPATDEYLSDCSPQVRLQVSGKGQCGMVKDTQGPFAECIKKVNPSLAFESCVMDLCLSTVHPESLCRNLQAFADLCQTSGVTVRWRSETLCPMACSENSVYKPEMTACPATCFNPSSAGFCTLISVEGCACSDGMVRDGFQKCIPVAQCGCQLNGVYHATGDVWYDDTCSYKYTCLEQSTILMVPITCQTSGTCQAKDNKVGCYCTDPTAGTSCDVESGLPEKIPNDPEYNPTAPVLPPNIVQPLTTTLPPAPSTTPAYVPPHPDGEIADDEYFNEPPPPPQPPKARPLGVESGVIPNDALKSSSSTPTDPPTSARPNSRKGWKPDPTDRNPHLTVDLGKPMDVHGLGTVGHYTDPCWVTNYNVHTSLDGENFTPLLDTRPEFNTQPRNFVGNTDQNTWKKHCLHRYYSEPIKTRYVRFQPLADNGCIGMRVELYGFRDGKDPAQVEVLAKDAWTRNTTGCICYFDSTSTDCACCYAGGCQCPRSNLHQCVQCGYAEMCGTPEIKAPDEQLDPWTISPTGCVCPFDSTRTDCACCQRYACQCGVANKNQCVTCGHPEDCGHKEEVFGPSETCVPKTCLGI